MRFARAARATCYAACWVRQPECRARRLPSVAAKQDARPAEEHRAVDLAVVQAAAQAHGPVRSDRPFHVGANRAAIAVGHDVTKLRIREAEARAADVEIRKRSLARR